MKKQDLYYDSKDGRTTIHAIEWIPDEAPCAVLQIAHGMVEYIDRYDRFASVCAEQGIYVVGNDHLGHGQSVTDHEKLGYFGKPDGNAYVISDMHTLRKQTQERFPEIPYFLLGHSMGSFLVRQYITLFGKRLAGAILMGTGYQSCTSLWTNRLLAKGIALYKGDLDRSDLLYDRVLGAYSKAFRPAETQDDWLTRDKEIIDSYADDELCQFHFTVNGYEHMFRGLQKAQDPARIAQIPASLPLLIISGENDPVGDFGKGPRKIAEIYRQAGITDVTCKLYPEDRHEILNELDRDTVDADILAWIKERLPAQANATKDAL